MTTRSHFRRQWLHAIVTTFVAIAFCLSTVLLPASRAEARGRGVAIGVGVVGGLILLNALSQAGKSARTGKSSKSHATKKSKKKTYGSNKGGSRSSSASRKEAEEPKADKNSEKGVSTDATVGGDAEAALAASTTTTQPTTLAVTGVASTAALERNEPETISSEPEIKAAQEHLRYMGYDVPEVNGKLDLKTKVATMLFQESIGEESTGVLTVAQLQALFSKVAERTANVQ